ncbi:helix-turn-helix domain-containing protein [Streptomyces sp. LBUM 1476]|nr:helix-turn-helix domain-containing protein [Streptomyces sp. LBUM 1476]MBZ3916666.1 helix-turn-helix transcriptional regulator [Streptomyces acidiscabies]
MRYLQDEAAPSAPRMVLGDALCKQREALGLQQQEVAFRLGLSRSKVSRIESGHVRSKERDLNSLFALYEIHDPREQTMLRSLAQDASKPVWWQRWSSVAPRYLQAVVSFEDMAQRIRSYEPQYLHGLLQIPEYSRALIERSSAPQDRHEALAALRAERQTKFASVPGKRLICVIDEVALRRTVGSPEIMRRQVEHLIQLEGNPQYQLRLAELGRCNLPVELGSTTIFDFAERVLPTLVYEEGFDAGLIIQDEESVDRRAKVFDALRVGSLTPPKTVQRLKDLLTSNYYR